MTDLYKYRATVTRVIDGDTLELIIDKGFYDTSKRRVRLLGVDTPERGQVNYKEATEYTRSLAEGKDVIIQTFKGDDFGRYLADVWIDGVHLNEALRQSGLLKENSRWNEKGLVE